MTTKIVGHVKQYQALSKLIAAGRLPSSLLFSGAHGIGKKLVALSLAKRLLCESADNDSAYACNSCKSCTLIEAETHPDLCIFECGSAKGGVDELRETLERLHKRAFMGGSRVTILDEADTISVVGANILLKTLEEPRPNSYFFLIAETPSRLPQTVLSRCQRWFFDRLSDLELRTILRQRGCSDEQLKLVSLAEGSVATLDSLTNDADFRDEIEEALEFAWQGNGIKTVLFAQKWGSDKTLLRERITLLKNLIRNKLIRTSANLDNAAVWANALQTALDTEHLIFDRHINPTLALIELFKSCNKNISDVYRFAPHSSRPVMERL